MEAVIVECRDSVPSQAGKGTLSSVRVLPAVFLRVTQVAQLLAVILNNGLLTEVKRHAARVLGEGRLHGEPQHQTETHPSRLCFSAWAHKSLGLLLLSSAFCAMAGLHLCLKYQAV